MFRFRTYIAIVLLTLVALVGYSYYSAQSQTKADAASLRAIADKGNANAQYQMALRYEHGDGVPVAYYQVGYYLRLAGAQGHRQALTRIKELHDLCSSISPYKLTNGTKITSEQAHACQASAELGDSDAQVTVGMLHDGGEVLEENRVMAMVWFKAAATHGDGAAQFLLARSYSEQGPLPDPSEEYAWIAAAAANSRMPAQLIPLAATTKENVRKTFLARYGAQALQNAENKAKIYISRYTRNNNNKKEYDNGI